MTDWLDLAVPLVASFEGCAKRGADGLYHPYLDTLAKPPVATRGYGRCYGITMDSPGITLAQAKAELRSGLAEYAARCLQLSPALASRPACIAAVSSWAWNCGVSAYRVSRLRMAIDAGRWQDAEDRIATPCTAGGVVLKGLQRRRLAEQALFKTGIG